MMTHLGHAGMIHAAAWMPLLICALEKLRHRLEPHWVAIGVLAVACCFLGGHPQISVYGIGMGLFYALFLGWSAPIGRWKFYSRALGVMTLGLSLCAIQIIPTTELSQLSLRAKMTFEAFLEYSLPTWQTLQLIFPYFFGGLIPPYNSYPHWGKWGLTETTGYVGLLPIMLGVIGAVAYPNRSVTRFWFWFGLITLLVAFGGDLLIGQALYYVPVYNKFRAQGRHFIEVALAVSVLAGLGVASIQQRFATKRLILKTITASVIVMLISLLSMGVLHSSFQVKASKVGIAKLNLLPWANPGVGIPLVLFGASVIALLIWRRWISARWSAILLLTVIIVDLSSFGWFYEWQVSAPSVKRLNPSAAVQKYRDLLQTNHQRFLSAAGSLDEPNGLFPNLTRLFDLPNAGGYSPLIITRVSQMLQMGSGGALFSIPKQYERGLDLMSIRYLLTPGPVVNSPLAVEPQPMPEQPGVAWANTDLGISLGAGPCALPPNQTSVQLDVPALTLETTEIGLITTMGCSITIPDRAEVLQVKVTNIQGQVETHSLQAGRDTAETAYDLPDIQPQMQHQRANVFRSFPAPIGTRSYQTHQYISTIKLNQPQQIKSLEIKWGGLPGVISISKMSFIDRQQNLSTPIIPTEKSSRWQKIEQLPGGGIVYENQQVLPRTWLVPATIPLQPEQVLTAIHTSRLPDGRTYEPKTMALVEDKAARFQSTALQPTDTARVLKVADTQVDIQTQTAAPAFLVLSDVNYPGWKATIDGKPTPIFQTNYIQRGVKVPAGEHMVRFEFHPLSFKLGAGITTATFFGCGYWLLRMKRKSQATPAE
jgi:hypothetical protein